MRKIKLELDEIDLPLKLAHWCRDCQIVHDFLRSKDKTFYWCAESDYRVGVLQLNVEGIIIESKWKGVK